MSYHPFFLNMSESVQSHISALGSPMNAASGADRNTRWNWLTFWLPLTASIKYISIKYHLNRKDQDYIYYFKLVNVNPVQLVISRILGLF